jgi:hypothetical protein
MMHQPSEAQNANQPVNALSNEQLDVEKIKATKRPLDPSLMDWARAEFTDEEIAAGLREIRETGGLELKDFVNELRQEASSPK